MKDNPTNYFACSKNAGKWLFRNKDTEDIKVLNNAVNVEEFLFNKETRQKIRQELNVRDELVIGHIGRFNKQKNHDFLIDIFKSVVEKRPDSVFVLVGEGDLKPQIEKKVLT